MKQKPKLALKKIMVSNLADDAAKQVFGGNEPTVASDCATCGEPCTASNCDTECLTMDNYACSINSCDNYCITADGCTNICG